MADDAIPTATQSEDHIKAARGADWPQRRVTTASMQGGVTSVVTVLRRGDDYVARDGEGPLETQHGSYQGQRWHQDENGVTVLSEPDPGNERPVTYASRVRAITTPVVGYVIETFDPQGYGERRYVDGATWRVVRMDDVERSATTTTLYDDFRTLSGRTYAWHWSSSDGHAEDALDSRITADAPGPVSDDELKIPDFRRNLFSIPAGVDHVDIPAHFEGESVYVRSTVGTRKLDLTLDTGASIITLDSDVAKQLGLKTLDTASDVVAGRFQTGRAIIPLLCIGSLELHDVVVNLAPPMKFHEGEGTVGVGLLGFDFLAQAVFKIDYDHKTVTACRNDGFTPPQDPRMLTLDIRLGSGVPMTTVVESGVKADRFIVDTGAGGSFYLFDYFVRRYPDALKGGLYGSGNAMVLGVGGAISARPFQFKSLQLGSATFVGTTGLIVTTKGVYDNAADGLIGYEMLRLFDVWLDYANSQIYLVLNETGRHSRI